MGLYDRGDNDLIPPDHAIAASNVDFLEGIVRSRPGVNVTLLNMPVVTKAERLHVYKRSGGGDRGLAYDTAVGLVDINTSTLLIAPVAGAVDFVLVNLYDRAYITFHDGKVGIVGSFVYVYDGTTFRVAAGTAPGGAITRTGGAAGKIEVGYHAYAVAFETASGFITKAGGFFNYLHAANETIDLATIPVGPAGTVARHILVTKTAYTGWPPGNYNDIEFFFLPGGKINDNVTTVLAGVSYYDADLFASADYLLDELTSIPSGSAMVDYMGRLAVGGFPGVDASLVRVSKSGQPESFSSVDGFCLVRPGDNLGVTGLGTYQNTLTLHKARRSLFTQDNGQAPATWIIIPIDNAEGAYQAGVGKYLDVQTAPIENYIYASRDGLQLFNGSLSKRSLTWKIDNLWQSVDPDYIHRVEVVIYEAAKRIYVNFPRIATIGFGDVSLLLVGNYEYGLDPDNIRWSTYGFPITGGATFVPLSIHGYTNANQTIKIRFTRGDTLYEFGVLATDIDDDLVSGGVSVATALASNYRTGYLGRTMRDLINHFAGFKIRARGLATLQLTANGLDNLPVVNIPNLALTTAIPGKIYSKPFNLQSEAMTFDITVASQYWIMSKLAVYAKEIWEHRPQ